MASKTKEIEKTMTKEGTKFDEAKIRLDLIPPDIIFALGEVLSRGADKYGAYNWQKGLDWSRVYAATQRHLNTWWSGDSIDPEWGKSHLAHALANICFLLYYEKHKRGTDDRPKPESE